MSDSLRSVPPLHDPFSQFVIFSVALIEWAATALHERHVVDFELMLFPQEHLPPASGTRLESSKFDGKVRLFLGGLPLYCSMHSLHQVVRVEICFLQIRQWFSGDLRLALPLVLLNFAAHDLEQNLGLLVSALHH